MNYEDERLFRLAMKARTHSHAPVSGFRVGAAVLTASGNTYSGCNVESVTLTSTTHAEVNAIDTAVASGDSEITKLLVVTNAPGPVFPCALCRQKVAEFSSNAEIIAATTDEKLRRSTVKELYPEAFVSSNLS